MPIAVGLGCPIYHDVTDPFRETKLIAKIAENIQSSLFWDSLSGGRALESGIFLVWTKHNGYAKSFLIRSIKSRMRTVSPATLIEAGRSFIVCSGH